MRKAARGGEILRWPRLLLGIGCALALVALGAGLASAATSTATTTTGTTAPTPAPPPPGAGAVVASSGLSTPWTQGVSRTDPLPEYPRPQLERTAWLNLNGSWQYEPAASSAPPLRQTLPERILVPFPVQSQLSGIGREDRSGWYRRTFTIPHAWHGQHVLLNFGAVSWAAAVYVNGRLATQHRGGFDAFSADITRLLHPRGSNELIVGFWDPVGAVGEPVGKQVPGAPYSFYHTASSGIWQTVWLEPVQQTHLSALTLTPDLARRRLLIAPQLTGPRPARLRLVSTALAGARPVARASEAVPAAGATVALPIPHPRLWSPAQPYLYGLQVELMDGRRVLDRVQSYFGMREISLGRVGGVTRILLNGHFLFQSGALDQGMWPDGLYTPPSDAAMRSDIQAAQSLGFDMLREHVKVEPDRWYLWADRLGLLVWQDMPNMSIHSQAAASPGARVEFLRELSAVVTQLRSHPSIVTWVPFNEGWQQFDPAGVAALLRRLDPTRLIDTDSGSANCCGTAEPPAGDMRDVHIYFGPFAVPPNGRASVDGEFGGVLPLPPAGHIYPAVPTSVGSPVLAWTLPTITAIIRGQYENLAEEERAGGLSAAVFTELFATEQELGLITYDRRVDTVPASLLRALNATVVRESAAPGGPLPQAGAVPSRASGYWSFNEGQGQTAADRAGPGSGSGSGTGTTASPPTAAQSLTLENGASWTPGIAGTALSISTPGQAAVSSQPVIDTGHSFTVSAWLREDRPGESGTAVSVPGPDGAAFSLGIASLAPPRRAPDSAWTFLVPAASGCTALQCGVAANMHYSDGRYTPGVGRWHLVTGVYDHPAQTTAIYVDGLLQDIEHVAGLPPAQGPLIVGAGQDDYQPSDAFIGAIDELHTWARALTPAENWELYRATAVQPRLG